jgi:hypothetical protein
MPKLAAEDDDAGDLEDALAERGFTHLRARHRGELLTIESGPKSGPMAHARLRRDTVHLWILEMPTHTGRWERTPYRQTMDQHVELLATQLSWALAPLPTIQRGTSGRRY